MQSLRMSVFCLLGELEEWVRTIGGKYDLRMVAYAGDRFQNRELLDAGNAHFAPEWQRVFLLSREQHLPRKLAFGEIKPKPWGWVDITPGRRLEDSSRELILLTEMAVFEAEVGDRTTWRAANALKRRVKRDTFGRMMGRNVVFGGERLYKSIWYTNSVRQAFLEGTLLKQYPDDNSIFEPIDD